MLVEKEYYRMTAQETLDSLGTTEEGLSKIETEKRLKNMGKTH